jgi:hypothetical protein
MGSTKIQNEQEVLRWFEEGRTYQWMVDEYNRKYHIETTIPMWANFRKRRGLARRITRDDDLIPWDVKRVHRWAYPLAMLRLEARRRAGFELRPDDQHRLASWLEGLGADDAVVYYDPDTEEGFFYVPREPSDDDLIRRPKRKTTSRRNADAG